MTTDRCYRKAETAETAREELLREAGHQFDPEVVRVFLEELDHPQPPATPEVHTSEGAIADELADRLLQVLAEN
jgi:HD-GYP domain-containing protein (c-di-GMP phosphodiesterase class II)